MFRPLWLILLCFVVLAPDPLRAQDRGTSLSGAEATTENAIPPFHLTRVAVDGEIQGDRAALKVAVDISVNRGDDWHEIPLRLGQAHVWRRTYEGTGEEAPGIGSQVEEGLVWKIRGLGRHQLTFELWVPIKRIPGGGQLQLSLPALPPQFEASLKIAIPQAPVTLRYPKENTTLLGQLERDGTTQIDASVAGGRVDLTWFPAVTPRGSLSQVRSQWIITPRADGLSAIVDQTVQFETGRVQQLHIKAPQDFEVRDLNGLLVKQWHEDDTRPGWLVVELDPGTTTDKVELRWLLERSQRTEEAEFRIDGLDIDGGGQQSGTIRFETLSGMRQLPDLRRSLFVQRVESSSATRPGEPLPGITYEYSRQPFSLPVLSAKAVTVTTSRCDYTLDFQEQEVHLIWSVDLNVEAGSIREFEIGLPENQDVRWLNFDMDDGETVGVEKLLTGNTFKIGWETPRTGRLHLRGTASSPYPPTESKVFQMWLPVPKTSYVLPALIHVRSADPLELKFGDAEGYSPLTLLSANEADVIADATSYRMSKLDTAIPTHLTLHARDIKARTIVGLTGVDEDSLLIKQQIRLDVQYGRVNTVGLMIPPSIAGRNPDYALGESVQIFQNDVRLDPVIAANGMRVLLPAAQSGRVSLEVRYRIPRTKNAEPEETLDLPVITIEEAAYDVVECQITQPGQIQVREGSDWGEVITSPSGALWVAQAPTVTSVPIVLSTELADAAQQYVVERAVYSTRFEPDGTTQTYARYEIKNPPSRLLLQLPPGAKSEQLREILINGTAPTTFNLIVDNDQPELRFDLEGEQPIVLELIYRDSTNHRFGLSQSLGVKFPAFPKSVWVDESIWEFQLPAGQHLFVYPDGMEPLFHWNRRGIFWQRVLRSDFLKVREEWTSSNDGKFGLATGYAFRILGPASTVSMRSMSQSLILLVGAGTSLLLGFLFWRFPFTRNLLAVLTLAFLVSVASMWYLESIQLLLQPALVGLALAGVATYLDARLQPHRAVAPAAIPTPAVGTGRGSSIQPQQRPASTAVPVVGTESATKIPSTIFRPGSSSGGH